MCGVAGMREGWPCGCDLTEEDETIFALSPQSCRLPLHYAISVTEVHGKLPLDHRSTFNAHVILWHFVLRAKSGD